MEQLCAACSGPGCTAVASRKAVGCLHMGSLPSYPAPCRSAASSRLSLQCWPMGGRTRGEEEKGVLALPLGNTAPGWLLVPGEEGRCCFGRDVGLCSDGSSQMQQCQQCSDTEPQDPTRMLAPAANHVGDGMGLSQPLPFANPKADAHPSAVKCGTSRAPLRCSAQSC